MLALFGCAVPDCVTAIVSDAPAEVDTRETVRANSRAQLSDLFEDEAPPRLQRNARTGSTRRIKKKKKHALARTVKHAVEEKVAEDGAASESLGKALWRKVRRSVDEGEFSHADPAPPPPPPPPPPPRLKPGEKEPDLPPPEGVPWTILHELIPLTGSSSRASAARRPPPSRARPTRGAGAGTSSRSSRRS